MNSAQNTPLFIRACRGEKVSRPPVWIMRQAGRYLPSYRALRARHDFLTLCKTPELAAKVTVQPIDHLGVDAAVIFSDILVLLDAMGLPIRFEGKGGPRIQNPILSAKDIKKLHSPDFDHSLRWVGDAIRLVSKILGPRNIPIIGFAGAPFTLACYAVDGRTGHDFIQTKRFLNEEPGVFAKLLEKLAHGISIHLRRQIEAGASVVQLFDTWGGILGQETYRKVALPSLRQITESLKPLRVPVILYVNGSSPHLETMLESGADVLSVDWRLPLSKVRKRVGRKIVLQGNLDPSTLFSTRKGIASATRAMLADHGRQGLIANLGHGILPDTPVENAREFVDAIKNSSPPP